MGTDGHSVRPCPNWVRTDILPGRCEPVSMLPQITACCHLALNLHVNTFVPIYDLPSSSLAYSSLITYLASSRFPHYVLRGGIPGPKSDHEEDTKGAGSTEGNAGGAPPFPQGLYTVPAATEHVRSVNWGVDRQSEWLRCTLSILHI